MTSAIRDGNMHPNLALPGENPQANFETFCTAARRDPAQLVGLRIRPDATECTIADFSQSLPAERYFGSVACDRRIEADAIILPREIGGFVLGGDCYPATISTPRYWAIMHLGWRAVDAGVLPQAVSRLAELDCDPAGMSMHLGPGLAACSNIVLESDAQQLRTNRPLWQEFAEKKQNPFGVTSYHFDLRTAILTQSTSAGVPFTSTSVDGRDTFRSEDLFSRRHSMMFGKLGKPRGNHVYLSRP